MFIFISILVADEDDRGAPRIGPSVSSAVDIPATPDQERETTAKPDQKTPNTTPTTMTSQETVTPPSADVAMETESATSTEKPEVVGSKESRTVFVSNLAMAVTEEKLREKFSQVGT